LQIFFAPTHNGVYRLKPDQYNGAFTMWGIGNKLAPFRVVDANNQDHAVTNFEIKNIDHCNNPYYAIAALIVCITDGIKNKRVPPKPVNVVPNMLSEEEKT
jgi:glutamine synthetase